MGVQLSLCKTVAVRPRDACELRPRINIDHNTHWHQRTSRKTVRLILESEGLAFIVSQKGKALFRVAACHVYIEVCCRTDAEYAVR